MGLQTAGPSITPAALTGLTTQYIDHIRCDETPPAFVGVTCPPIPATGPTLFGRLPGHKGAPDAIPIGKGLTFANGTLSAVSELIGPPGPVGPVGSVGPVGPAGPLGTESLQYFSFGDASPAVVRVVTTPIMVLQVNFVITTPFNGAGATLSLGVAGQPQLLVASNQIDAAFATEYETNPNVAIATNILLAITPGAGCTQGAGWIVLNVANS